MTPAQRATGLGEERPVPLAVKAASVSSWLWRFRTLQLADKVLGSVPAGAFLTRRFAGGRLALEVARSTTHRLLFLEGERFVKERAVLLAGLGLGGVAIDIGANIGYITMLLAKAVGEHGHVVACEPMPENLEELRRNVSLNSLEQVRIVPVALGRRKGVANMTGDVNGVTSPGGDGIQVEMRPLDSFSLDRIDLVKIDVEGHEAEVLAGARALIRRAKPRLFIEVHPKLLPDCSELAGELRDLEEHGYRLRGVRARVPPNLLVRALSRYLSLGALEESANPAQWLSGSGVGGRSEPFWLLCEPVCGPARR